MANLLNISNRLSLLEPVQPLKNININISALRAKGLHKLMLPHWGLLRLRDIREHLHDGRSNFLELAARMCDKEVINMNEKMEAATERDVTLR